MLMRKIATIKSKSNARVMLTNFSATLDLRAQMSNNCSINNYAVLDIFLHWITFDA